MDYIFHIIKFFNLFRCLDFGLYRCEWCFFAVFNNASSCFFHVTAIASFPVAPSKDGSVCFLMSFLLFCRNVLKERSCRATLLNALLLPQASNQAISPPEIFRTCFVVRYNKLQSFFPLRNSTASYNHFASPQNYQPGAAVVCLMLFLCIMTGSKWLFQIFLPLSYLQTNVHLGAYFVFPVEASVSGITIFFIHSHTYWPTVREKELA